MLFDNKVPIYNPNEVGMFPVAQESLLPWQWTPNPPKDGEEAQGRAQLSFQASWAGTGPAPS